MSRWIDHEPADRLYMLNRASEGKNIDMESVEKDWWVTAVLKALFEMKAAKYMFFKGGTSLSKGWNLISRFSEDIDIALYRDFFSEVLGDPHAVCANNNQIKNLRKASRDYILGGFLSELIEKLKSMNLPVTVRPVTVHMTSEGEKPVDHDTDPTVLNIYYTSILSGKNDYVKPVVKVEISCLSMKEPYEIRHISSLVSAYFKDEDSETASEIPTISPSRTFLEKAFLLNEEYQRRNPRTLRMSRHLYDMERLMDTLYGRNALSDINLYKGIIEHRRKFYHVGGVDYDKDLPEHISFCPEGEIRDKMREDYQNMVSSFIYGNPPDFDALIRRIEKLQNDFRAIAAK